MWRRELKYLLRWIGIMLGILVGLPVAGWLLTLSLMFAACEFRHQCV